MKLLLLAPFFVLTAAAFAQDCPRYAAIIRAGDSLAGKGKYIEALNKYYSAQTHCKEKAAEVQALIKKMFLQINQLKITAEHANDQAQRAKRDALVEKAKTAVALEKVVMAQDSARINLEKANKLINAFYFYHKKFALAFSNNNFYFIDTLGNSVDKLGRWIKAEQFDDEGFAKVQKEIIKRSGGYQTSQFLLDTMGVSYPAAYDIRILSSMEALNVEALDITGKDFGSENPTDSSNEILENKRLKILRVRNSSMTHLLPQIGKFKELTYLSFLNSGLDSLPAQIGELKNLVSLRLMINRLSTLPGQIGELDSLTSLDVSGNQLTTLPEQTGKLGKLASLNISENELTHLPAQMGELKNLTLLDLRGNENLDWKQVAGILSAIPKKVQFAFATDSLLADYKEVRGNTLRVQINEAQILPLLISVPAYMSEFKNLTSLNVSYQNGLNWKEVFDILSLMFKKVRFVTTSMPSGSDKTPGDTLWVITGDAQILPLLAAVPALVSEFRSLMILSLSNIELTTLSPQISELKNLELLNISHNYDVNWKQVLGVLHAFPKKVRFATQTQEVPVPDIQHKKPGGTLWIQIDDTQVLPLLIAAPARAGDFKDVTSLGLSNAQLTTLPAQIGQLDSLASLTVSNNQLKVLPEEIRKLKNLSFLNISMNKGLDLKQVLGVLSAMPKKIRFVTLRSPQYGSGTAEDMLRVQIDDSQVLSLLIEAPDHISDFRVLTSLSLSRNQLTTLPPQIGALNNLTSLNLSQNRLTTLPPEIGELKRLQYLWLSDNPISAAEKEKIKALLPRCRITF